MIPYILHVTVIITCCFVFYKALLQQQTFYRLNRWMLLACLAVAFALPKLTVPAQFSFQRAPVTATEDIFIPPAIASPAVTQTQPVIPSISTPVRSKAAPITFADLVKWAYYIWLSGLIILGASLLFQVALLFIRAYTRPVVRDGRYRIVEMTGDHAPCSFGNYIYINPSRYDWDTYQQILIHEKVHASGRHTLDILLVECAIVLQWFNPFVWFYKREVEKNLEFLTDQEVLNNPSVERSAYQLSLLKVSVPNMPLSITSNYNQSLLKRRIIMMNTHRSSIHTVWKYFFLLPLLTLLVCALNQPGALAQTVGTTVTSWTNMATLQPLTTNLGTTTTTVSPAPHLQPQTQPLVQSQPQSQPQLQPQLQSLPALTTDTSRPRTRQNRNEGSWFITSKDNDMWLELKGGDDDHNWSSSSSINRSDFSGLSNSGSVTFTLKRDAGTVTFTGQFDGRQGFGHYSFKPDAGYTEDIRKSMNVEDEDLFSFFQVNIKREDVAMFKRNFPDIKRNEIISMAALHIDEPFITSWKNSGYADISEQKLITLKALKIDKAYAEDLKKAGYEKLTLENLITFRSLNIDGAYIHGLNLPALPPAQDLITYKSLNVSSEYIASLKQAGYAGVATHDLVTMKSVGIDGSYIESLRSAGYNDLPAHDLVTFKSIGVDGKFIQGFRDLGYKNIAAHDLITLKSIGVTADYVHKMRDKGFVSDDLQKYIRLKTADF